MGRERMADLTLTCCPSLSLEGPARYGWVCCGRGGWGRAGKQIPDPSPSPALSCTLFFFSLGIMSVPKFFKYFARVSASIVSSTWNDLPLFFASLIPILFSEDGLASYLRASSCMKSYCLVFTLQSTDHTVIIHNYQYS